MTKSLTTTTTTSANLLTLVEGPYFNFNTSASSLLLRCDRLLLIGGGIGIASLVSFASGAAYPNVKLAWSVTPSARCLVDGLDAFLSTVDEKDIRISTRLDISTLLNDEVEAGWEKVGVVVSGPGGLCDDVREAVVVATKPSTARTRFESGVEADSW